MGVPIVDVLGLTPYLPQYLSKLVEISGKLDKLADISNALMDTNTKLDQIYERLEHVKVDSFVNVRLMDSLGELPVPAGLAGLLVEFIAAQPVTVVNSSLHTTVDNTVNVAGFVQALVSNTRLPVGVIDSIPITTNVANAPLVVEQAANPLPVKVTEVVPIINSFITNGSDARVPVQAVVESGTVDAHTWGYAGSTGDWRRMLARPVASYQEHHAGGTTTIDNLTNVAAAFSVVSGLDAQNSGADMIVSNAHVDTYTNQLNTFSKPNP